MTQMTPDTILVVDVESTCWQGNPPPGETSEIIEIGVTLLDGQTLERSGKRSILVKPARSKVSAFCTELTTLRAEDVAAGLSMREACAVLENELQSRELRWASYGDYDRKQFHRNCDDLGIGYPFGAVHMNVKKLFADAFSLPKPVGMAGALRHLKLPLEGTHHRGGDDAWNIAAILGVLLRKRA